MMSRLIDIVTCRGRDPMAAYATDEPALVPVPQHLQQQQQQQPQQLQQQQQQQQQQQGMQAHNQQPITLSKAESKRQMKVPLLSNAGQQQAGPWAPPPQAHEQQQALRLQPQPQPQPQQQPQLPPSGPTSPIAARHTAPPTLPTQALTWEQQQQQHLRRMEEKVQQRRQQQQQPQPQQQLGQEDFQPFPASQQPLPVSIARVSFTPAIAV